LKTIYKIFISISIGAICTPVFFSLYGIVASFDVEHQFLKWIYSLPKEYRLTAGLFHSYIVEMVAAIPIVFIAGIIIGFLVKGKPSFHGLIAVISFFLCETIYNSILFNEIGFYHFSVNIWYTILSIISWILLFVLMTKIGITIFNKSTKKTKHRS
jgi:hypothetical protein